MKQFDEATGYFKPKRLDTLRERAKPFIGMLMTFIAYWRIDEEDGGSYVGQWTMHPIDPPHCLMGWVPEEDIEILETSKKQGD